MTPGNDSDRLDMVSYAGLASVKNAYIVFDFELL